MTKELKKCSPLRIFLSDFQPHIRLFAPEIDGEDDITEMPQGFDNYVVEQGGHDELLERNGVYADLWRTQNG